MGKTVSTLHGFDGACLRVCCHYAACNRRNLSKAPINRGAVLLNGANVNNVVYAEYVASLLWCCASLVYMNIRARPRHVVPRECCACAMVKYNSGSLAF